MATRTEVKETRALDHIYDLCHITTAPSDHHKLTAKALATQLERVPDAASYFSELVHYPRAGFRPGRGKDSYMPKYIDASWAPRLETDKEAEHVFGRERYKYDRRPIVRMHAFTSASPQIVMYETPGPAVAAGKAAVTQHGGVPLTRTVGTQSIYRESEAQTVPYTPEAIAEGNPEILTLKNLT